MTHPVIIAIALFAVYVVGLFHGRSAANREWEEWREREKR